MLTVKNLSASTKEGRIIDDLNFEIKAGEIHALMGLNGSGKSTFAKIIAGFKYKLDKGSINFIDQDLLTMNVEKRAQMGIFLAFQNPIEVPGITNSYFLKIALNSVRKYRGESELNSREFMTLLKKKMKLLEIDQNFITRGINEDFSGGEKKRNEILQLLMLEPRLAILDEIDSGLDIDSLQLIAQVINNLDKKDLAIILITHHKRLLEVIKPHKVHILHKGKIIHSGNYSLAEEIEKDGYQKFIREKGEYVV